jgi:hypothetical protein
MTIRADIRRALGGIPQGLRRPEAAAYVGVSPCKLDEWVAQDIMPRPRRKDGIVLWLRDELDAALRALPDDDVSPYDEVAT